MRAGLTGKNWGLELRAPILRALERFQRKAVILIQVSSLMHWAYLLLGQHFKSPSIYHLHSGIFTKLMAQLFTLVTL